MRVLASDSIASVKLRIQTWRGFVVKKQRLVLAGREMARNDGMLVGDYGVADGNVLHLVLRLSDLRAVVVRTTCGKTFRFQADKGSSVGYIRRKIAEKGEGLLLDDFGDQKLICDGKELEDSRLIDDICDDTSGGAVIHLLASKSAKVRGVPFGREYELSIAAPGSADTTREFGANELPERTFFLEPVVGSPKVELSQAVTDLINATIAGLDVGKHPILSAEGSGGVYFMQDATGRKISVFKPIDEEPMAINNPRGLPLSPDGEGLKRGTRVGEGAFREVAAYLLDHPSSGRRSFSKEDEIGFSGVPPTVLVRCLHEGFHHPGGFSLLPQHSKIGSLQLFVKNQGSCEDMGPRAFPVQEVHKISVLDIRLANTDRHGGNILVCKQGGQENLALVPIDHGYCLPENFEDCTFEWLYWPQAREPYNSETLEYIKSLDAEMDIALLKFHGWELSIECARTLRISTMLLKKGAARGLTPFTIGSILCRETVKKESVIEEIVQEAKQAVLPGSSEDVYMECVSDIMDLVLDKLG